MGKSDQHIKIKSHINRDLLLVYQKKLKMQTIILKIENLFFKNFYRKVLGYFYLFILQKRFYKNVRILFILVKGLKSYEILPSEKPSLAHRNFNKLHGGNLLKLTYICTKIIHGWVIL